MKIISINIEGHKHLADRVIPFLERESNIKAPDVVCLQEIYKSDYELMQERFGWRGIFVPMMRAHFPNLKVNEGHLEERGQAILTPHTYTDENVHYYYGSLDELQTYDHEKHLDAYLTYMTSQFAVMVDNNRYVAMTTHSMVTKDGGVDEHQRKAFDNLLGYLNTQDEFILTGDSNAPRGKGSWERLAKKYTDNIPLYVTTTIDGDLHKKGQLPYVVDCLFTTPEYKVSDVRVVCGVSDHCAIVGEIERV